MYGYKVPLKQRILHVLMGYSSENTPVPGHFVRNVQVVAEDMSFIFIPSSVSLHHTNESSISIHISATHTEQVQLLVQSFSLLCRITFYFFFLFFNVWWWMMVLPV